MYSKEVDVAKQAARLAGQKALEELDRIHVNLKNGDEVVTQADPICQQIIIDHIRKAYPEDGFVAEEGAGGEMLIEKTLSGNRWWVIDPIDGTNNYSLRMMIFSVSIALVEDGIPVVGIVYWPSTDKMFEAIKNGGTFINGNRRFCNDDQIKPQSMISIDSYWPNGFPDKLMQYYRTCKVRNLGSTALHLAHVASGALSACVVNKNKVWDFAAGALLITEAGGKITYQDGKDIFPLNPQDCGRKNFTLLASNKLVHNEMLEAVR